jgi:hypothetical protein
MRRFCSWWWLGLSSWGGILRDGELGVTSLAATKAAAVFHDWVFSATILSGELCVARLRQMYTKSVLKKERAWNDVSKVKQ